MIRCNTGQTCNYSWSSMRTAREDNVRFCPQCQQVVYWVDNYAEFQAAAQKNQCIAFEPGRVLSGAQAQQKSVPGGKQFLLLAEQKLSLKQLNHIKKYIHPDWNLRRLRDSYHKQAAVIKFDGAKEEADRIVTILRGLNITVEVRREETSEPRPSSFSN